MSTTSPRPDHEDRPEWARSVDEQIAAEPELLQQKNDDLARQRSSGEGVRVSAREHFTRLRSI